MASLPFHAQQPEGSAEQCRVGLPPFLFLFLFLFLFMEDENSLPCRLDLSVTCEESLEEGGTDQDEEDDTPLTRTWFS